MGNVGRRLAPIETELNCKANGVFCRPPTLSDSPYVVLASLLWQWLITCHLLDAFIQSDLHTQYCGQFGVKCLAQGHNDMLTAVGFEPVLPWSEHQRSTHCATRLHAHGVLMKPSSAQPHLISCGVYGCVLAPLHSRSTPCSIVLGFTGRFSALWMDRLCVCWLRPDFTWPRLVFFEGVYLGLPHVEPVLKYDT